MFYDSYDSYDGYEWRSKDIFRLEIMLLILFVLFTIHEIYQLITIILFVFLPKSLKSKFSEKVIEEKKFSKPKSRLLLLFLGNNFLQLYLSQDLYQMEVEEGEKLEVHLTNRIIVHHHHQIHQHINQFQKLMNQNLINKVIK